jgi:hypothetical protein
MSPPSYIHLVLRWAHKRPQLYEISELQLVADTEEQQVYCVIVLTGPLVGYVRTQLQVYLENLNRRVTGHS